MYSKAIIIKSGESETWIPDKFSIISYGDVLRTTTILKSIDAQEIYWYGSEETFPLIPNLPHLTKKKISDFNISNYINQANHLIINLEKIDSLQKCNFSALQNFCGFLWQDGEWKIKNHANDLFESNAWNEFCSHNKKTTWGSKLHLLIGQDQSNTIGYLNSSSNSTKFDIGLNWKVGNKWPSKQIEKSKWENIEKLLTKNYTISWQEGYDHLPQYIEWIQSCRLIITTDSLGLHLAMAFNLPTIALFGSTSSKEIDKNINCLFIDLKMPEHYNCRPCLKPNCTQNIHCSEFIDFEFIRESAINLLNAK